MFLHGLRIENFRAIRKTSISLDERIAFVGENDCGISSVLDALELLLGYDDKEHSVAPHFFHRVGDTRQPAGAIRIQLRFRERQVREWSGAEYQAFKPLLDGQSKKRRELWYEAYAEPPPDNTASTMEFRLRAPGIKGSVSDALLVGRLRRMNPMIRVAAGMMTGRGNSQFQKGRRDTSDLKLSAELQTLVDRIRQAVDSRLTRASLNPDGDLESGYDAAARLLKLSQLKLGKWESGLTRSVAEIMGWAPGREGSGAKAPLNDPDHTQKRLGILLLIGALIDAWPGGMAPDADPLWVIEEPEAHLHPMTLTSVAIFLTLIQRQKIFTTYSGELLANMPLGQVRRLVRHEGVLYERRVRKNYLTRSELRRFHYHVRSRFGIASFARLWMLVEGESECWILPQLARLMGYEFSLEGIVCVEFAQSGLDPPLKVARELGIEWHVLADGDDAGRSYENTARRHLDGREQKQHLTVLGESDIERFFWSHGYDEVYRRASKLPAATLAKLSPAKVIRTAVRKQSKPFLALSIVEAVAAGQSPGIPAELQRMVETCIDLARHAPERLAEPDPG